MTKAEFIEWLEDWSRAYPETVFPPIDMRDVQADPRDRTCDEVVSIAARNAAAMARDVLALALEEARKLNG